MIKASAGHWMSSSKGLDNSKFADLGSYPMTAGWTQEAISLAVEQPDLVED
jgi:hypothetical protein